MKQSQQIVACIDKSRLNTAVCDYAAWLSQRLAAPLTLLHSVNQPTNTTKTNLSGNIGLGSQKKLLDELIQSESQNSKLLQQQGKLLLDAALERVRQAGISAPISLQRHGGLAETLIELEDKIQFLVLGMEGQQLPAPHISSQLETVIRALHRPILMVNTEFTPPKEIMLAYDGSEIAGKTIDMVVKSSLCQDLHCHLVGVNKPVKHGDLSLEDRAKQLEAAGIQVTFANLSGKVDLELAAYQQQHKIDLTIMGAFSHTRVHDLLLGSFTLKMLLHSKKPVLLLR